MLPWQVGIPCVILTLLSAYNDRAVCVVQHIITDRSKDSAADSTQTPGTHYDKRNVLVLGYVTQFMSSLSLFLVKLVVHLKLQLQLTDMQLIRINVQDFFQRNLSFKNVL